MTSIHRVGVVLAFLMATPPAASGRAAAGPQADQTPAPTIGDGAAACAEGKSAYLARLGEEPALSLASANFDATYYHLDLDIDLIGEHIGGIVRVEGVVVGSAMATLVLDLAAGMTVSAVSLADGTPVAFTHAGHALNISLPSPVSVGGDVKVDVTYGGTPVRSGFGNFVFGYRTGARFAWSLSEPYGAREWWPCKDHPSDKADSVRVTVTVPSQYRVGSQGNLVSETSVSGMTTYDWVSNYPIASYLVSVAVGEYVTHSGTYIRPPVLEALYGPLSMPLEHLMYNDGASDLFPNWALAGDMLEVFEDWFGPYPFANEKYGHAECTFNGGMEHQTMSSMASSLSINLVSHELAHQWYGDKMTPRIWRHLWLNEGFATYGELIYLEERASTYPGEFEAMRLSRYDSARNATGTLVLDDTTSISNMFAYTRVYAKGAAVLHMLRTVVGDATFKNILLAYAIDPAVRYGVAMTADFQRVAESVSGMDLDTFFGQWITDGFGHPSYRMSANWYPNVGGYDVYVAIEQTQTMPASNVDAFEMPVTIAVQTLSGEERFVVHNDQRSQLFEFSVSDEPTTVMLDPDQVVLRDNLIASGVGYTPAVSVLKIQALTPNPAGNTLSIRYELGLETGLAIEVFDAAGRRVLSRSVAPASPGPALARLDTSSLPVGVYFIRISARSHHATQRFVVVR